MVIRAPFGEHLVDVSVVSWNSWGHLQQNLPALIDQDYPSYRVVVVDNDSTDETVEHVEAEFPDVDIVRCERNGGYGAANNLGFARSQSKYVAVLNPDARPERGWLRSLVRALEAESRGRAGHVEGAARLRSRARECLRKHRPSLRHRLLRAASTHDQHDYVRSASVTAVSGAAFIARRDALEQIGGFDERFFMYMEDTELSLRARLAGWDVVLAPRSRVVHDYELDIPAAEVLLPRTQSLLHAREHLPHAGRLSRWLPRSSSPKSESGGTPCAPDAAFAKAKAASYAAVHPRPARHAIASAVAYRRCGACPDTALLALFSPNLPPVSTKHTG